MSDAVFGLEKKKAYRNQGLQKARKEKDKYYVLSNRSHGGGIGALSLLC